MRKRNRDSPVDRDKAAAGPAGQRQFRMAPQCLEDLRYWVQEDQRTAERIMKLMSETLRDPFDGIGKPEPMRGAGGVWSRRITDEHRLTYRVTAADVHFLQARFHYSK